MALAALEPQERFQAGLYTILRRPRTWLALFCALIISSVLLLNSHESSEEIWSLGQSTLSHFNQDFSNSDALLTSPDTTTTTTTTMTTTTTTDVNSGLNYTKVATILEPRMSATLIPLLISYLAIVPPDWPFVVWCSSHNYLQLISSSALSREIDSGRLNLTMLPDNIDIHNGEYLSRFLTKPWFYHQFHAEAEWMLFFQTDAVLCSASDQSVDDWLGYEWVGSPTLWTPSTGHGGNGGLGIRRISTMQQVTADTSFARQDWLGVEQGNGAMKNENAEDYWFMTAIDRKLGDRARWPEQDERDQNDFSIMQNNKYMRPLGVHKGHTDMGLYKGDAADEETEDGLKRLLSYCPELALIMDDDDGRFNG